MAAYTDNEIHTSPKIHKNEIIKDSDNLMCLMTQISKITNQIFSFSTGNVKIFIWNNKVAYLWQDGKGNVSYKFDLENKDFHTTSVAKLSNVLSSHFEHSIDVLNNVNDFLKKKTIVTTGLNKAISDSQNYDDYSAYSNSIQEPAQQAYIDNEIPLDGISNQPIEYQQQQEPNFDQKELHQQTIELSEFQFQYRNNTASIYVNELPLILNEDFKPESKQAFGIERFIYRNKYIPSKYMIQPIILQPTIINSFIVLYIKYMTKGNTKQAFNILIWLASSFNLLQKNQFVLVLHSENDSCMKLFYEEIIEPLFNPDHCEQINSDELNKKSLSLKLDEKVIYNFNNIVSLNILKAPSKELIKRLIYKDTYKLNNKNIYTKANIIITSTSNYIPLIAKDVPNLLVNIESSLESFCVDKNITTDYYKVANLIKQDLDNFSFILRSMDINQLYTMFNLNYDDSNNKHIMNYDVDILEVFEASIKYIDKPFFKIIETKSTKLYNQLMEDFDENRVNRKSLINYFSLIFGDNIYKNNTALISDLRDLSSTSQPFENKKTFQIGKVVYYKL